jgi:CubicO group peptidase (beta-lactamase class C family)
MRKNNSLIYIIPILFLLGTAIYCTANTQENKESYRDIIGYWQEYIIKGGAKEKTSIRKITLNTEGNLTQSITYEMATQCRIWLNDDDISFKNGRLDFWGGEFSGEMSDDKNSVLLTYKQMSNPFLLERIRDKKTIELIDRIEASQGKEYAYYIPEQTGDGWECTDLEDVGINKEHIIDCVSQIRAGKYKDIHSLLIVKNGKLAFEEYFGAEGTLWSPFLNQVLRDRIQMLASVTKSVNSALIGIAVEKGMIPSIQDPAFEMFPEYAPLLDNEKNKILIEHLLTMSAGLEWNELDVPYSNPQNDVNQMGQSPDWVQYCLEKPMVLKPGEKFNYHSGLSLILGEILKRSSGTPVDTFAEKYLFNHLGISEYKWSKSPRGLVQTGGGLALRARDMAKFGQLYLNSGQWEGQQIIPEEWVNDSTRLQIKKLVGGYGYQWWMRSFKVHGRPIGSYYALGRAGQFIMVFPAFDLIVVSTDQNYDYGWSTRFYNLVHKYILQAVMPVSKN